MVRQWSYKFWDMKNTKRHGFIYWFNIVAVILILLFTLAIPLLHAYEHYAQTVDIEIVPNELNTSVFFPTSFAVTIQNASNTPLNAVEFEIQYDPELLLVTEIIPHTTLCEERFIISKTINQENGTLFFQCGTIAPFSGTTGIIATINATPLTVDTPALQFGTTTHVLAHDGFGTDVTRNRFDLSFTSL